MENKAEDFLERYREIEEWVANNLNVSEIKELEMLPKYKHIKSKLSFCRYLRNLLSHHDWSKGGEDLIIVTDRAVKVADSLYYSLNPATLKRIATPVSRIFAPSLNDSVLKTMSVMNKNDYSYVPVVDNGAVKGVFSAKTLLRYITEQDTSVSESLSFEDIIQYISITVEKSKNYDFLRSDDTVEDAIFKLRGTGTKGERIDLLLITDTGDANGRLMGLITPTDLVGI